MRASQSLFGFTSMSDYIKRSTVTEWLSPKHRRKTNYSMKMPRGKQLGEKMISLQMSNKFHRLVGVRVLSLTVIEVAAHYSRAALWVM